MNMPYLAFVTLREVPARTELTIDYDPNAARLHKTHNRKGKQRQSASGEDTIPCRCKVANCRGIVKM
jgi:[histone H3]-lysine9 N-trimethyltransferase SUV39H